MKLLFYIYSLNKGGAERVLLALAGRLAKDGYDVSVLTDTFDEREYDLPDNIRRIDVNEYYGNGIVSRIPRVNRIQALGKCFKEERPDRIVAFMLPGAVRAIKAAKPFNTPVISCVRYDPHSTYVGLWKKSVLFRWIKHSYRIVCQNEYQKTFFSGNLSEKCDVIFNPISSSFMVEPYVGERRKVIVSTGRLVDFKRFDVLISAFSEIADKYPDYNLVIYGEGPYRSTLEQHIEAVKKDYPEIDSRISLPGDCNNVAEAIKDASLYVLSSEGEGMPNSLLEAMALGLPVIATDCAGGGPASLIEDGVSGYLVPVDDIVAMSARMDELLSDDAKRESFGVEASKIQITCSMDAIIEQWKKAIE